jgi:uncharacterized protein (UPF0332 family)
MHQRRKRHRVIYEIAGLISKKEAEQSITFAQEFLDMVKEITFRQSKLGI